MLCGKAKQLREEQQPKLPLPRFRIEKEILLNERFDVAQLNLGSRSKPTREKQPKQR
jgi:hypothetical protein